MPVIALAAVPVVGFMVLVGTATIAGCKIMIEGAVAVGDFFYGLAAGLGVPHDEVKGEIVFESDAEMVEPGSSASSTSLIAWTGTQAVNGTVEIGPVRKVYLFYNRMPHDYYPYPPMPNLATQERFNGVLIAKVKIDESSTKSSRPWTTIEWDIPDDLSSANKQNHPDGKGGYGGVVVGANRETLTNVTARVKRGNTYLNITDTITIVGVTQIAQHRDDVLQTPKNIYSQPLPTQHVLIPDNYMDPGRTVRVMGTFSKAGYINCEYVWNTWPAGGEKWKFGFMYEGSNSDLELRRREWDADQRMKQECIDLINNSQNAWDGLGGSNVPGKESFLNSLLVDVKAVLGVSVVSIYFYTNNNETTVGQYLHQGGYIGSTWVPAKTIALNRRYFNSTDQMFDVRFSVIHECRHAFQHEAVDGTNNHVVSRETITHWKNNFPPTGYYENPDENDPVQNAKYASQPVELDAFMFTNQFPEALMNAMIWGWELYWGSWQQRP